MSKHPVSHICGMQAASSEWFGMKSKYKSHNVTISFCFEKSYCCLVLSYILKPILTKLELSFVLMVCCRSVAF